MLVMDELISLIFHPPKEGLNPHRLRDEGVKTI